MKNWKRFLAALLALVLCIGQVPALTAPAYAADETCPGSGNHTKANCDYTVVHITMPDCGSSGFTTYQCNVCQETFVEDIVAATGEHQWVDMPGVAPTCTKPGYEPGKKCSVCGMVISGAMIPALSKTATECEWVDMTPVIDCVTGGVKIFQCAFCGATREISIAPGQHNWDVWNLEVIQPATATETGLARVSCTICGAVKEIVVFFTHTHDSKNPAGYIVTYPGVAATCTTTGMKSYMQCRVCGAVNFQRNKAWGWYQLTEEEWASLVIPAAHSFEQAPTCTDNVRVCLICEETITVNVAHSFKTWSVEVMPTCSQSGYQKSTCANCGIATDVKVLPALGHYAVTVNMPATCATNAYYYTYCTRIGCEDGSANPEGMYPMTVDVFTPVNAVSVGEPFYLGMTMATLGTELYFTGAMDGNYLAASHNINEAVPVYLEIVHPMASNAYRLFFHDAEGVKTYIEIYEYDPVKHKVGVHLTTAPVNAFNWNAELGILTSVINNATYYLGSYKTYDNFSASAIRYITGSNASKVGVSQFPAYLSAVGAKEDVCVISYAVEQGGFDSSTHHSMVASVLVQPTCTEAGVKQVHCALCGFADMAEIPAGHRWEALTGGLSIDDQQVPACQASSCEDGWQYYQCSQCQEIQKMILPGYGHVFAEVVEQNPDHLNVVVYDYQSCIYCGFTVHLTEKVWNDANKQWDTFEQANEAHGGSLTDIGTTIKAGNCADYGLKMYTCEACNKKVYVKIAGTGQHIIPDGTATQAPSCVDMGYIATYECERCGAVIGAAPMGELNMIPALGHILVENSAYKPAACDKPNYANYSHICAVCGVSWSDGTTPLAKVEYDNTDPCTSVAFEYYLCHCGEEHMISFITKLGHNMVELPRYDAEGKAIAANFKAPTCYETGYTTYVCAFCGLTEQAPLAKVEHTNKAGEKFTDKCTDTVTDRHCVVCHDYFDHDTLGNAHDCTKLDANKDGVLDCLGECMISSFHHWSVNQMYPSTCGMGAYHLMRCADCGYETVNFFNDFTFSGHKPASNLETYYEDENGNVVAHENGPQPTYLAGYIYDDNYVWYSIEVVNGEFVQHAEAYTAKYIEYVPATNTSDGYVTMYCQECRMIVTQTLPKTGTGEGSQGLEYTLSEDGTYYIVTGIGTCTDTELIIPSTYNGLPITEIGDWAFKSCNQLISVTLPTSITVIGNSAFSSCYGLTNVVLNEGLQVIGEGAFYECGNLADIQIPEGVTAIGNYAFFGCYKLTNITMPTSVTGIGTGAFQSCSALAGIYFNGTKAQWDAIEKGEDWDTYTGDYTVHFLGEQPLAPELVITAEDVRVLTGNWATVTLWVERNPGFQGMSLYPVITDTNGNQAFWPWEVDNTNSAFNFDVNVGTMIVLTADEDCTGTGVLLEVRFFIGEEVEVGEYTISFRLYQDECFNEANEIVAVELPTITVNALNAVYGDANGDRIINLQDVLLLRRYLANRDPDTGESSLVVEAGADANGDGTVSLKDALLLRQYLANRDPDTGESTVVLGPK